MTYQPLESLLSADERNIRDMRRFRVSYSIQERVIASCARHFLDSRGTEFEQRAEDNLREALEGWRK